MEGLWRGVGGGWGTNTSSFSPSCRTKRVPPGEGLSHIDFSPGHATDTSQPKIENDIQFARCSDDGKLAQRAHQ